MALERTPLADWSHATSDIPDGGLQRERSAGADDLALLSQALNMLSLKLVKANYRVQALPGGAFRLHGNVVAEGAQRCVVTLEPVAARVDDAFDVEFWPKLPEPQGGEDLSILDTRDVEPLEDSTIPVGRIVYETISAALDPYPRKEGAVFDWADEAGKSKSSVSPFAALAQLKNKK